MRSARSACMRRRSLLHVFFRDTDLSRECFPTKSKAVAVDILTLTGASTGHNVSSSWGGAQASELMGIKVARNAGAATPPDWV